MLVKFNRLNQLLALLCFVNKSPILEVEDLVMFQMEMDVTLSLSI